MKIKIKEKDIIDYVIGKSSYDPIEKIIDPTRYEVFDCGIYDNRDKTMLKQNEEYENYCSLMSKLREAVSKENPPLVNVSHVCAQLEKIAPTEINLNV